MFKVKWKSCNERRRSNRDTLKAAIYPPPQFTLYGMGLSIQSLDTDLEIMSVQFSIGGIMRSYAASPTKVSLFTVANVRRRHPIQTGARATCCFISLAMSGLQHTATWAHSHMSTWNQLKNEFGHASRVSGPRRPTNLNMCGDWLAMDFNNY